MRDWIRRHKRLTVSGAAVGLLLIVFVVVWFEPHKAFIDERVDETIPQAAPATTVAPDTTASATTPQSSVTTEEPGSTTTAPTTDHPIQLSESIFVDVAHGGSGSVLVLELEDGSRIVRFEDLDVLNGPDLVVILSDRPVTGSDDYADGEWLSLGELKGNQGNQNYDVPADVDLAEWESVAIWCRRFNTTFNVAALSVDG